MAHIALTTDGDGCLWSVDFNGILFWNGPDTPTGHRATDAEFQYRGFGVAVGSGWRDVIDLLATEIQGERVLFGVDTSGAMRAAVVPRGHPRDAITPSETGVVWPDRLQTLIADADGRVYGVSSQGTTSMVSLTVGTGGDAAWQGSRSLTPGLQPFTGFRTISSAPNRLFAVTDRGELYTARSNRGFADPSQLDWSPVTGLSVGPHSILTAGDEALYLRGSEGVLLHYVLQGVEDRLAWDESAQPVPVGTACDTWAGLPAGVEGYASAMSVAPGERIRFYMAERLSPNRTAQVPDYAAALVRLRRFADGKEQVADTVIEQREGTLHAPKATLPMDLATYGAQFPEGFAFTVPRDVPSGLYAARCTDTGNNTFYIPFVVRPTRKQQPYALLANTNTWNCYNSWGGLGKYAHNQAVLATHLPFNRPGPAFTPDVLMPDAITTAPNDPKVCANELLNQTKHLVRAELWILGWLQDQGYGVDVYADPDLHHGIAGLSATDAADRYAALILSTHPEYWTAEMYDAVVQYQSLGGSVLYLGANGLFERVEYLPTDGGVHGLHVFPAMDPRPGVGHETARKPSLMRNQRRPERAILGNGFETVPGVTVPGSAYELAIDPTTSPALLGVPLRTGDCFGATAILPTYAAVGHEIDFRSQLDGTPKEAMGPTALLARGTGPQAAAEMLYFETTHGGIVFAAGSLNFGKSLVVDPTLQQIVRNVMDIAKTKAGQLVA